MLFIFFYPAYHLHQITKGDFAMRREKNVTTVTNKKNNGGNTMKGFFKGMKKKMIPALCGMGMTVSQMSTTCFASAAGTSAVTAPLESLKTLVIAVIGAVGVIILAKNVMELLSGLWQIMSRL